jgi:hypothetical protein
MPRFLDLVIGPSSNNSPTSSRTILR